MAGRFIFCIGDEPKSGLAETLATAYDPGMCLLALYIFHVWEPSFVLDFYRDV